MKVIQAQFLLLMIGDNVNHEPRLVGSLGIPEEEYFLFVEAILYPLSYDRQRMLDCSVPGVLIQFDVLQKLNRIQFRISC